MRRSKVPKSLGVSSLEPSPRLRCLIGIRYRERRLSSSTTTTGSSLRVLNLKYHRTCSLKIQTSTWQTRFLCRFDSLIPFLVSTVPM